VPLRRASCPIARVPVRHIGDAASVVFGARYRTHLGLICSRLQSKCWSAVVARRSTLAYPWATAAACALVRRSRAISVSPGARRSASIVAHDRLVAAAKNLALARWL